MYPLDRRSDGKVGIVKLVSDNQFYAKVMGDINEIATVMKLRIEETGREMTSTEAALLEHMSICIRTSYGLAIRSTDELNVPSDYRMIEAKNRGTYDNG